MHGEAVTREDVARCLAKLAVMLPHTRRAKLIGDPARTDELAVVISGYHEHLARFPAEALEYATKAVIGDSEWFPTVAKLVAACEAEMEHGPGVLEGFRLAGMTGEMLEPLQLEEGE